jgi:hypothetical protein
MQEVQRKRGRRPIARPSTCEVPGCDRKPFSRCRDYDMKWVCGGHDDRIHKKGDVCVGVPIGALPSGPPRRARCDRGHDLTVPGARYPSGKCAECSREHSRAHHRRKAETAA